MGYVQVQLGHSTPQVTASHYAKWCATGGVYREPLRLLEGEVPADLLARLSPTESPPAAPSGGP